MNTNQDFLLVKDGSDDSEGSNGETLDGKNGCPLFQTHGLHCPNTTNSLDCPLKSDCPFKQQADPDAPGKVYTARDATARMAKRETSRREQDKLIANLKWEKNLRRTQTLLRGETYQEERREKLAGYLPDCLWPAGQPISMLGEV